MLLSMPVPAHVNISAVGIAKSAKILLKVSGLLSI